MANFTENAKTVLTARYLKKDDKGNVVETPSEMLKRVADALGNDEVQRGEFYRIMDNLDFLPNTPTLINAGKENGQLSACFVLPVEDSMEGIFDAVKRAALIHKTGGGTGFSFSRLRGKGQMVSTTGGVSSGVVSFLRVFNEATNSVTQGGVRRGANMGILRVDHPDIEDFIMCKDNPEELTNFNLSVAITDEFVKAVESNSSWNLIDPHSHEVTKTVNARDIWNMIIHQAWKNGEPGVVFIDEINRYNPTPDLGEFEATNPCVTGDTKVLTDKGYYPIADLVGKKVNVWNGVEFSEVEPRKTGVNAELIKIVLSDGAELRCTPYHKFYLKNGEKVEAGNLAIGDKLEQSIFPVITDKVEDGSAEKYHYTLGFFSGDGSIEQARQRPGIFLYDKKRSLQEYMMYNHANVCAGDRIYLSLDKNYSWSKTFVPLTDPSLKNRLAWLAGLIDSDGTALDGRGAVGITSVNQSFLLNVKLLLNTLGVTGHVAINKPAGEKFMPDGNGGQALYKTQDAYRLTISATSMCKLIDIGLNLHRVAAPSSKVTGHPRYIYVSNIEKCIEREDVYCFTESLRHRGCFNGIVTGQCGEQPLLPYESCNLGSINVSHFVKPDRTLDTERLHDTIVTATDFLNCVLDKNSFPLPMIKDMTLTTRKIGLGVMGFADALIKMGIPYNSEKAREVAKEVMFQIKRDGQERSEVMGYHNATITTIAPTGTISMLANASSGIEPNFSWVYTRNSCDRTLYVVHPLMEQKLKEMGMYTDKVLDELSKGVPVYKIKGLENIGSEWITSQEISPSDHIKMQAAFQRYTDNAVSKTINLAHEATEKDVENAYTLAYKQKCKGVTVYRDGSRASQVLNHKSEDKKPETSDEVLPKKKWVRPESVSGSTVVKKIGCGKLYVTVNSSDEGPIEVFTNTGKAGGCPAQSEGLARMVSLALRYGIPVDDIINQLAGIRCMSTVRKAGCNVLSCPDAIAKVLKSVKNAHPTVCTSCDGNCSCVSCKTDVKEEPMPTSTDKIKCPECGAMLEQAEGCVICHSCGYSKCG